MKRFLLVVLCSLVLLPFSNAKAASSVSAGNLIKASGPAVYYYTSEGMRLVFPNEKTYFTWYEDFSNVKTISDEELASISIGGNVTYRPGKNLIKITTDPKVYAVDDGGALRWITTETLAIELYGSDWAKKVHDIPDAFFVDYEQGSSITSISDFNPTNVLNAHSAIETPAVETVDRGVVKTSDVTVGDLFRITIDSNASTGYTWTPTYDEQYVSFVTSTYVESSSGVIGAAGTQQFDFRAVKQTSYTDIAFNYARPWKTGVAPVERRTFRIIINPTVVYASDITLQLSKSTAQKGESVSVYASTTVSNPEKIILYAEDEILATCANDTFCSATYTVPSTGTLSSYGIRANVTDSNGASATTTKSLSIVSEETRSDIGLTLSKSTIRQSQSVDISVDLHGTVNARNITIRVDSTDVKACQTSPKTCTYSGSISGSVGTTHTIYATIISVGGQTYKTVSKTITIAENDSPSVTITAGKSALYNTETVEIFASANDDDGVDTISIKQGNTVLKTCNGPALCTVTVGPFPSLSSGDTATFTGIATDLLDLEGTSDENAVITIL